VTNRSRRTIEGNGGFSLIGDAHRDDVMVCTRGPFAEFTEHIDCESRYLERVMFDLTRRGEVLCELAVGGVDLATGAVKRDRSDAGRARVQGDKEVHTRDDNQLLVQRKVVLEENLLMALGLLETVDKDVTTMM
jgi:hypothetical protein